MAYVGMKYVVAAKMKTENIGSMPVYENGKVLGRAIGATVTYNRATNTLKADDVDAEAENSVTGGTLSFNVDDIADDVMGMVMGQDVTTDNEYDEVGEASPYIGIGYIRVRRYMGETSYVAYWIFKAQLGINSESAATKQDTIQWQTPELEGTMMGVQPDATMKTKFRRHKTFTGETAEADAYAWLNNLAGIEAAG